MKEVFKYCGDSGTYKDFVTSFLVDEVVGAGAKSVKDFRATNTKNMIDYFQIEERAATGLNPYLLRFVTSFLVSQDAKELRVAKNCLTNLLTLHMAMVFYFQGNQALVKKLLKSCLKLTAYCQKHCGELAKSGELQGVIQSKLLNLATSSIDFSPSSDKKFSEQQLLWLELHLSVDAMGRQAAEEHGVKIGKVLEDSKAISTLKQQKEILKERDNFHLLKYLHHLKNISQEQRDAMKKPVESNKPVFDVMTRSLIQIPEAQRITVKFKDTTKIKPLCYIGVSNDPKTGVVLKGARDKEFDWPSGSVYLFYPVQK
jgi:hypothetical protein